MNVGYLRVSLLNACNLHCSYCRPPERNEPHGPLGWQANELKHALATLINLGVRKVRFTGGEPTLYKELPGLIEFTKRQSAEIQVAVTTNGLLLDRLARSLAASGLDSVNVSLDTLIPARFRALTSVDSLDRVLSGIDSALEHIPSVKLNCVVMRGVNDDELPQLVSYAESRRTNLRFIEFMPNLQKRDTSQQYLSGEEMRQRLQLRLEPLPHRIGTAARYYRSPDLHINIGFISPVSEPFCAGCDRIRLGSDGRLYGCLFSPDSLAMSELLECTLESAGAKVERLFLTAKLSGGAKTCVDRQMLPCFSNIGG